MNSRSSGSCHEHDLVDVEDVVDHLRQYDGTGDPEYLDEQFDLVRKHPRWVERYVLLRDIIGNDCCGDESTAEYASMDGDTAPSVVLLPEDGRYMIIDGGHRVEAARMRGEKGHMAFVPRGTP